MTYEFNRQLAQGRKGEAFLDAFFSGRFIITEPHDAQRKGYDRRFEPRDGDPPFTVEYKTDRTAARTNNAFVETVSVDTVGKRGWAYTSQAQWLAYYIPEPLALIYMIRFADLRVELPRWCRECDERRIPNEGYCTVGRLVPLAEFERIADAVLDAS